MLAAALIGALVAAGVVLGSRSAPDVQRYRRIRAM
jgi:hypothetical protein